MDIALLSKMVKQLILERDVVTLPGLGAFVAEFVGSTFSDRGYTIHPPYRRLSFTVREGKDSALVDLYCSSNQLRPEAGVQILFDFLSGLRQTLKEKKLVVFPGLGRLRATRENNFFFVPDEDLDIFPAGFGLEPISLKNHVETEEEVAGAVANLAAIISPDAGAETDAIGRSETPVGPAVLPLAENAVVLTPETAAAPTDSPASPIRRRKMPRWGNILLWGGALALLILLLYMLVGRIFPQWIDPLLYNEEELEILRQWVTH